MPLPEVLRLNNFLLLISACAIVFGIGAFAVSLLPNSNNKVSTYANEGFDFGSSSDESNPSAGPKVGDRIDLTRLKTDNGIELAAMVRKQLVMLVTVDPECGACKVASDEMRDVHSRLQQLGIEYYPVFVTASVARSKLSSNFLTYADSLGLKTRSFSWVSEEPPPEALFLMVLPSHILVDSNGKILRKWPGTDKSPQVRRRMANQIIADTVEELKLRKRATEF